jgi:hypothetical protein
VARAAIVLDNTTTAATSRSSSLTFSHTVGGGSDRLLVVCIAVEEDSFDANVSTVTYNGVAMTNAVDRIVGSTTDLNVEIWYMLDASLPPTGSYDVVITCPDIVGTSDILASAISVTGAAQAGPEATAGSGVLLDVTPGVGTDPVVVNEDSFVFEWFEIIGVHDGQDRRRQRDVSEPHDPRFRRHRLGSGHACRRDRYDDPQCHDLGRNKARDLG